MRFMRLLHAAALTVSLLGLVAYIATVGTPLAQAQVETGQISGTVTDPSGAVVPNATVSATNLGTNAVRSVQSSASGTYAIGGLAPATYQIKVISPSFKPYSAKAEVTVGGHVTLDAKLSVTSAVTEVQVVAEGGTQVNVQSQELSQVVDAEQVAELPSLTRNPYDFVAISGNISNGDAGASGSGTGNTSNGQNTATRGVGFNINGQRSTGTEILLDGVENVSIFGDGIGIFVPLDAMQEYRVSTSNFEAQFGRASGGVVNVTTKSGTNAYHASAWEYNRLSAYTSNTETNDQLGAPKGTYTRNQFGFAAGGPAIKNKLFLFGSSEWIRVRSSAVVNAAVPTPEFLAKAAPNVYDFFNRYGGKKFNFTKTYTAGQVYGYDTTTDPTGPPIYLGPAGLDPATPAFGIVTYNAPVNAGGDTANNTYNWIARADYNLSDKTQLYYRLAWFNQVQQDGAAFASPYSQYDVGATSKNSAHLLSVSHMFSPSFSTNTKLAFSRFNTSNSYDTSLQNTPTLDVTAGAVLPGAGVGIQLPGFYDISPANGGLPYGGPQNTSQINQDASFVKGRHVFQGGAQLVYIQSNNAYGAYAQAVEQLGKSLGQGLNNLFTGDLFQFQAAVDPKGALPCYKDPYTGALTATAACSINLPATSPSFARSNRFRDWAVYAQDSWKATPKLTFNYGVRYEYYGVQHNDNQNLDSNYYYGSGSALAQRIRNGGIFTAPESPIHKLWNPTYGTVSPRVGFAYDVFGNGRDSIRGGFGIAYERNFGNVTFNVIQNPPNYAVIVINNTKVTNSNAGPLGGNAAPTSSPCYPAACLPPTSARWVDQDIKTAQTQFWSLALEHQISHATMVSAQYVGAHGVHLYDIKNYNGLGSGNFLAGDDPSALTRLNNQYSNMNNRGSSGYSHYDGLNLQFQTTNLGHTGLGLIGNYTYAHQLDNLSTTFSEDASGNFMLGYTDPFNPSLDYGSGDLDVRHRLVIAPIYTEPYFKNQRNLLGQVAGGWQISGIYQVHSGAPFSYFDQTSNYSGYNVARYTPATAITKHSFTSIPSGADGGGANLYTIGHLPIANSWSGNYGISDWGPWPTTMTSRNSFRGPGIWNLDLALSKTFPVREGMNIEFRAEGFNILNHHNLFLQESFFDATNAQGAAPEITASKGGIGNNGGANDERRFGQFALKLNF
jgi:outer membrane receptor protein involved in Fe transport